MLPPLRLQQAIESTVREEWGRILSSLVKSVGDMQLAEDSLQDAIVSAIQNWQKNGLPRSPAAWLITTARRRAIDRIRRDKNFAQKQAELTHLLDLDNRDSQSDDHEVIPDKRLEMIFTCCHPALEEKSRIALTLRTLGGLSTEEIARAFLDKPDAMQRRLTRAKKKIAVAGIPFRIPEPEDLPERIASVLNVVYLIFNEGYSASNGKAIMRLSLADEAIRLGRTLHSLIPDETEIAGLLALMLLHDARRHARIGADDRMVTLAQQNRSRWNRAQISEGLALLETALCKRRIGPFQLQAAISGVHAQSRDWHQTDWSEISALYDLLGKIQPSPVVSINHAVALSYAVSPDTAINLLDDVARCEKMDRYQPYFAARADILSRSGRREEARTNYDVAIKLSRNSAERRYLVQRRDRLD